ncbi:MAG TPA: hypothetical protein VFI25_01590 [Planctomycetota bacterium]|nr:hypothetical protein [Planctomycetota bacterium]
MSGVLLPLLLSGLCTAQPAPASRPLAPPDEERAFKDRVNVAVERGVAWLRGTQKDDGSWGDYVNSGGLHYRAGTTSIALLALLASDVNKFDAAIEKGFRWLGENPARLTYEIGLAMMAHDLRAAPLYERFEVEKMDPAARRAYRFPRELESREREQMLAYVDQLEEHRFHGLWSYGRYPTGGDVSNAQYALLGLKAAVRCGLKVDAEVWGDSLDYFLRVQIPRGPSAKLPRFKGLDKDGRPEFYAVAAVPRGWCYGHGETNEAEVSLSTSCIGIASLILCREELLKPGPGAAGARARARTAKVEEAIRDALAWLDQHFSIGGRPPLPDYHYYYLYALERAGILTESRYIGTHDWYREGAEFLVRAQRADGSWPGQGWSPEIPDTSFALLFLRRSTFPVVYTAGSGN